MNDGKARRAKKYNDDERSKKYDAEKNEQTREKSKKESGMNGGKG